MSFLTLVWTPYFSATNATSAGARTIHAFPDIDFTATSILEKFQNETATGSVDRVLKKLASKKAEQMMAVS